ncbi:unnamed protein product [Orchesella dallaii]|uniref:Uncharacterized protein n=1 Tax=Orchesella dallaii TaxID=48710 RepID=A0ABP1PVQ2_9HEXA
MRGVIILVSLCLFLNLAEGLEFYNCVYLDDDLPSDLSLVVPSESSCKPGKKPDKKFLVDCSKLIYTRSGTNGTENLNVLTNVLGDNHPLLVAPK